MPTSERLSMVQNHLLESVDWGRIRLLHFVALVTCHKLLVGIKVIEAI